MASIHSLPFEILSHILHLACEANIGEGFIPSYTYGLSQITSRPLDPHKLQISKHVRGRMPTDTLRWLASDAIRRTCSRWHEWAPLYAIRELYIRRWRGGESWESKFIANPCPSGGLVTADIYPVVYKDPYKILKTTTAMLKAYPHLGANVKRLWFMEIYNIENMGDTFSIIRTCTNIRSLSVPWTTLRYGTVEDWVRIAQLPQLTSLEFLAVDLKQVPSSQCQFVDNKILEDTRVDFSRVRRLKLNGTSSVMGLKDGDLWEMARTMRHLEEVHVTGCSMISVEGIIAFMVSSHKTLKLLEYSPLDPSNFGTTHHNPSPGGPKVHFCKAIKSCTNLRELTVTVSHICEDFFLPPFDDGDRMEIDQIMDDDWDIPNWEGKATIRVPPGGRTCCLSDRRLGDPSSQAEIQKLLDAARDVVSKSRQRNHIRRWPAEELDIEITMGNYTFNPISYSVAGCFQTAKKLSEGMWQPEDEKDCTKGPYGSSGIWGNALTGELGRWSEIREDDFWEGVSTGLVHLE